jgi:hypothetical protein
MKVDISWGSGTGFSTVIPAMTFAVADGCAVSVSQAEKVIANNRTEMAAVIETAKLFFMIFPSVFFMLKVKTPEVRKIENKGPL